MSCPIHRSDCPGIRKTENPCPVRDPLCTVNIHRFPRPNIKQELDDLCQTHLAAAKTVADQYPELAERIQQQAQAASSLRDDSILEDSE